MQGSKTVLGIDLGTSGVEIALINDFGELLYREKITENYLLDSSESWAESCKYLIRRVPKDMRNRLSAISIDGTSGTLLACNKEGTALGPALTYDMHFPEEQRELSSFLVEIKNSSSSNYGSIGRALKLHKQHGSNILLRHQADWITGWFLDNWEWGEESNNVRLGWDLKKESWPKIFLQPPWVNVLPKIVRSGTILQKISFQKAKILDLPRNVLLVSGTTDSNAATIAANLKEKDGLTVLGSTIVIKSFFESPINEAGITNHRIQDRWLVGGASNTGGIILKKFFNDTDLKELSKQINPETNSGIELRPMVKKGERFPIQDPNLQPILEPRPISDALFLQALFEGLAKIEAQGWEKLISLGLPKPTKIITIGGGARNPQWRRIRERAIGIKVRSTSTIPAKGVAIIAANAIANKPPIN